MQSPRSPHPGLVIGALTAVTVAVCAWIAVTVNFGSAVIGLLGVAAALWLYVAATRPLGRTRTPIPVPARTPRPMVRSKG